MPGAAQQVLGAAGLEPPHLGGPLGHLQGPGEVSRPVEVVGVHVEVLRQLGLADPGRPDLQRTVAQLDRAVEIARLAPHRVGPRQPRQRHGLQLRRALAREHEGPLRERDRLRGPLRPERGARAPDDRLHLVGAVQLGDQRGQLLVGAGELFELHQGEPAPQADAAAILVGGGELERPAVQVVGLLPGQRGERAIARGDQVLHRALRVSGLPPVERQHPGQLLGVRHRGLDHARRGRVQLPTHGSGQGRIGDVADQHVLERVLDVALQLTLGTSLHQAAGLEGLEGLVDVVELPDTLDHASPERLPDHRCVQQARARAGRERVDPRRDGRTYRRRQLIDVGVVRDRRGELFEEERVPFRPLHQLLHRRGFRRRAWRRPARSPRRP